MLSVSKHEVGSIEPLLQHLRSVTLDSRFRGSDAVLCVGY